MKCGNKKCGKEFLPRKPWAKYHSLACAEAVRHRKYYLRRKRRLDLAMKNGSGNKKRKAKSQ